MDQKRDRATRVALGSATLEALTEYLEPAVVAIIRYDGHSVAGGGSGTLLEVDGRVFIATAAHVIAGAQPSDLAVALLDGFTAAISRPVKALGWKGGAAGGDFDLGWLEVVGSMLDGKTPIQLSQVDARATPSNIDELVLTGFPGELIDKALARENIVIAHAVAYLTKVFPEPWSADVDRSLHTLLDYPQAGNVNSDGATVRLPNPTGMSGGGIWSTGEGTPGLWTAEKSRLVGIGVSWHHAERWVRGQRIVHWLQFLAESHPDLTSSISAAVS